ncbi:hypothetical protein [Neobacillus mesonae]|nr:hypothetical protein [Neobacillus mesonae]
MKKHKWSVNEQASFLKRIGELLARGYPIAETNALIDTKVKIR